MLSPLDNYIVSNPCGLVNTFLKIFLKFFERGGESGRYLNRSPLENIYIISHSAMLVNIFLRDFRIFHGCLSLSLTFIIILKFFVFSIGKLHKLSIKLDPLFVQFATAGRGGANKCSKTYNKKKAVYSAFSSS